MYGFHYKYIKKNLVLICCLQTQKGGNIYVVKSIKHEKFVDLKKKKKRDETQNLKKSK